MASLLFAPGFISVFDNASPSKGFRWLASVFFGIIMCKIVYDITATVSFLCFKGYGNLSNAKKVEWNNRGFSTFHAIVVAFASLYLLLLSDLFKEDYDGLIINRTSAVSETIFGVYNIIATVSFLCFKGYGNLSNAKKVEWNNRGFSTFHAIIIAFASLYLLLLSDLFKKIIMMS